MKNLQNNTNVDAGSSDYPLGVMKDTIFGGDDGTALYTRLMGDIWYGMYKIVNWVGLSFDDTKDTENAGVIATYGYQFIDGIAMFIFKVLREEWIAKADGLPITSGIPSDNLIKAPFADSTILAAAVIQKSIGVGGVSDNTFTLEDNLALVDGSVYQFELQITNQTAYRGTVASTQIFIKVGSTDYPLYDNSSNAGNTTPTPNPVVISSARSENYFVDGFGEGGIHPIIKATFNSGLNAFIVQILQEDTGATDISSLITAAEPNVNFIADSFIERINGIARFSFQFLDATSQIQLNNFFPLGYRSNVDRYSSMSNGSSVNGQDFIWVKPDGTIRFEVNGAAAITGCTGEITWKTQ